MFKTFESRQDVDRFVFYIIVLEAACENIFSIWIIPKKIESLISHQTHEKTGTPAPINKGSIFIIQEKKDGACPFCK